MTRIHFWVLALAITTFCTGMAVGVLLIGVVAPASPLVGAYADYETRFVEVFHPSSEDLRLLRKLLLKCQEEEEKIKNRYAEDLEPELRELAKLREEKFLKILTKEQKEKYQELLKSGEMFLTTDKKGQ